MTVVAARFAPVVTRGLVDVLGDDCRVRVLASGLESFELERAVVRHAPRVAILNEEDEHST